MVAALGHKQQVKALQEPEASNEAGGLQSSYLLARVLRSKNFNLCKRAGLVQKAIKAELGMDLERCQEIAQLVTSSTSARCSLMFTYGLW